MKIIILATALAGMLIPAIARADLDYNWVGIDFAKTSQSGSSDTHEFDLDVVKSLNENVYITAGYGHGSQSTTNGSVSSNAYDIGLGYHLPIKENIDFIVEGDLARATASLAGATATGNGYDLGVGIRAELIPQLEGKVAVTHASQNVSFNVPSPSFTVTSNEIYAELAFKITKEIQIFGALASTSNSPSIGASYTDHTAALGLRYYFQ